MRGIVARRKRGRLLNSLYKFKFLKKEGNCPEGLSSRTWPFIKKSKKYYALFSSNIILKLPGTRGLDTADTEDRCKRSRTFVTKACVAVDESEPYSAREKFVKILTS